MLKTYQSKVVPIQALEVNEEEVANFANGGDYFYSSRLDATVQCGGHTPKVGDFTIVLNPKDIYLCPKDVFNQKYELVLPEYMQRVITEAKELDTKFTKLKEFLDTSTSLGLSHNEQVLLTRQADAMFDYHTILLHRIQAF